MGKLTQLGERLAFLRRAASDMRSKRNLRGAMEVEKIADELARTKNTPDSQKDG